ncbi:MAG: SusC/RagA family TonB-linked outer membrane protein [Clostridium sp.]|nr:SusC/RagA family TonB-linked outer membrane protein [Bacteroides sp.]MCM1198360.1 SusC/RagA family TonB-linked outer membrane protein [Clostridium sp.]
MNARDKTVVSGVVTSRTTNEPVAGVAVFIAGTAYNAYTDADGKYELSFIADGSVHITFQLLGMKTVKMAYVGQKVLDVEMEDDSEALDDVVVTGYNKIRRQGFTGSTTTISKDELLKVSPKNLISSIQVFDPSFRLMENITAGANPNALPEFYMRGQTAVNMEFSNTGDISRQNLTSNNNLPIFILDGFEVSVEKIYDMDPTRITNVTLLKDAAATAMYGSRASNGVVVMESRAPEEGRLRVAYNFTASVEMPDLSAYNLLDARGKLEAEVAAGYYPIGDDPASTDKVWLTQYPNYIKKLNNVERGVNTDWMAKAVRTSFHHKHSLYIDGGTQNIRWGAELRYDNTDGVMRGTDRTTYGAALVLDYRVGKFQILDRVDYDVMGSNELPSQNFSNYSHLQPYDVPIDPITGDYVRKLPDWGGSSGKMNPLYEAKYMNSYYKSKYNELTNKLSINWFATKDLTAKVQFSIDRKDNGSNRFIDPASSTFASVSDPRLLGTLSTVSGESLSWDLNVLLLYNKSIKKHYINVTAGAELIENNMTNVSASYTGFPSGKLSSINNAMVITGKPVSSSNKTRLASFLVMANYSWNDIYLLDASLRLDGSSEFGRDEKVAPFWAAGAGLNIHNYGFLRGNPVLSTLKIRATYGQTGKVNFPVYAAKSSYVSTSTESWYLTGMGYIMQYFGNDDLTWEKTNSIDAGLDVGLFKDRFTLKFTYYDKNTVDMITSVTLPSSSGFTSYMANMGKVKNRGVELDLRYNVVKTRDWDLTLFGSMSHNKNRIMAISDALKRYNELVDKQYEDYRATSGKTSFSVPHTKFIEGGSTTSIFAMKSLGINPANGQELFITPAGDVTYEWNAADQQIVGDTEPIVRGAFGFNLRWKNFSLFTSFLYRAGGYQYNQTLVNYVEDVNLLSSNADRRVTMLRWRNPGDLSPLKSISASGYVTRPTSRFVQKDNLLQFNSLSLSYDFSPKLINKAKISMLRLTASMQDLGYWSTIRRERGLEYPYSRTFNFSLNITF